MPQSTGRKSAAQSHTSLRVKRSRVDVKKGGLVVHQQDLWSLVEEGIRRYSDVLLQDIQEKWETMAAATMSYIKTPNIKLHDLFAPRTPNWDLINPSITSAKRNLQQKGEAIILFNNPECGYLFQGFIQIWQARQPESVLLEFHFPFGSETLYKDLSEGNGNLSRAIRSCVLNLELEPADPESSHVELNCQVLSKAINEGFQTHRPDWQPHFRALPFATIFGSIADKFRVHTSGLFPGWQQLEQMMKGLKVMINGGNLFVPSFKGDFSVVEPGLFCSHRSVFNDEPTFQMKFSSELPTDGRLLFDKVQKVNDRLIPLTNHP